MPPVIALIGRPNVGKSTLFNRLARRSKAITHDRPGVTRDRVEARAVIEDREVVLVDTGGMVPDDSDRLGRMVMDQARAAIGQAHLVLFVVDARDGLTGLDHDVAELLRQCAKPVLVAVNKADGEERAGALAAEFYALGFPLVTVSAAHGRGVPELRETLADLLPPEEAPDAVPREDGGDGERPLRLAMIGRPNAGKSSLVNSLVGENRLIVSEIPGTTRDAVDVAFARGGSGTSSWIRPGCVKRPASTMTWSGTRSAGPCKAPSGRTWPSWSSTPRAAWACRTRSSSPFWTRRRRPSWWP
jgi:GTP-binding protein